MSSQSSQLCLKLKSEAGTPKDLLNARFRLTRRPALIARHVEIKEDLQQTAQEFIVELRYHCIQLSKHFFLNSY